MDCIAPVHTQPLGDGHPVRAADANKTGNNGPPRRSRPERRLLDGRQSSMGLNLGRLPNRQRKALLGQPQVELAMDRHR
jgi:hypothetical protein